jgi:hypothetical protein
MTEREDESNVPRSFHAERLKLALNEVVFGCASVAFALLLLVLNWGTWFELAEYRGRTLPTGLPGAVVVLAGVGFMADGLRRRRALRRQPGSHSSD